MYHLDNLKRQKYWCSTCSRNHFDDTKIGKSHYSKHVQTSLKIRLAQRERTRPKTKEERNKKIDELREFDILTMEEIAKEAQTSKQYVVKYLYDTGKINEAIMQRNWKLHWGTDPYIQKKLKEKGKLLIK